MSSSLSHNHQRAADDIDTWLRVKSHRPHKPKTTTTTTTTTTTATTTATTTEVEETQSIFGKKTRNGDHNNNNNGNNKTETETRFLSLHFVCFLFSFTCSSLLLCGFSLLLLVVAFFRTLWRVKIERRIFFPFSIRPSIVVCFFLCQWFLPSFLPLSYFYCFFFFQIIRFCGSGFSFWE